MKCPFRPVMDMDSLKADTYGHGLDGTSPLPCPWLVVAGSTRVGRGKVNIAIAASL
jgi:hypothetical protein